MQLENIIRASLEGKDFDFLNLKEDPFYKTIKNPLDTFIGREEEIKQLARDMVTMSKDGCDYITVLGRHGAGKTHLLYVFKELIERENFEKMLGFDKIVLVDGINEFREKFCSVRVQDEEQTVLRESVMFHERKRILLFIDDLDVISVNYPKEITRVFDAFRGRIIGTCNSSFWAKVRRISKIPSPEVVLISSMTKKESEALLKKRIGIATKDKSSGSAFTGDVVSMLAEEFGGNPIRLLSYAKRYLNFLITKKTTPSLENYLEFLDTTGVKATDEIKKEFENLTIREREFLKVLLMSPEATADQLAEKFNITRVGAFKHLQALQEKEFLEKRHKGRSVVYYVPPELLALLQKEENKARKA